MTTNWRHLGLPQEYKDLLRHVRDLSPLEFQAASKAAQIKLLSIQTKLTTIVADRVIIGNRRKRE
jgi:hypothetical protein